MTLSSSLPAWFTQAIKSLQTGDIDGWMEIYAPDAIHEFPFAPAGSVRILEGRDCYFCVHESTSELHPLWLTQRCSHARSWR